VDIYKTPIYRSKPLIVFKILNLHVETPYMASLQKHSNQILIRNSHRDTKQTKFNPVETHDRASLQPLKLDFLTILTYNIQVLLIPILIAGIGY